MLLRFYTHFEPKMIFNDWPPMTQGEVQHWLHDLGKDNVAQFVANLADRVIGHIALFLSGTKAEAELVVFIHQDFRGLGIGKIFVRGVLGHAAAQLKLKRVHARAPIGNLPYSNLLTRLGFYPVTLADVNSGEPDRMKHYCCELFRGERSLFRDAALPLFMQVSSARSANLRLHYGKHCERGLSALPIDFSGTGDNPSI